MQKTDVITMGGKPNPEENQKRERNYESIAKLAINGPGKKYKGPFIRSSYRKRKS